MLKHYTENVSFSGLLLSGKDFVAEAAGFKIIGFADPLYILVESLTGSQDKSIPEVRSWLQWVGQWAWGYVDPNATAVDDPYHRFNPTRICITNLIRTSGHLMVPGWKIDWSQYGHNPLFWVDILLTRIPVKGQHTRKTAQIPMFQEFPETRLAVTNVRFPHEFKPLKDAGLPHYLVLCSEETRKERIVKSGKILTEKQLHDKSEHLAWELREKALAGHPDMPAERVIWNDHRPMPPDRNFILADDWIAQQMPIPEVAVATL